MTDEGQHRPRSLPSWAIVAIGILVTGAATLWASGLRDDTGDALLDKDSTAVLIALLGAGGTFLGILVQRAGEIRHQVKNSHGTNLRDDMDGQSAAIAEVRQIAEHALLAAQKASGDTTQLREDVQAGRLETGEVRADVRGLRKDIGWIRDYITKGTTS